MILQGRRAVITGGGRGIGAAIAKTLAAEGASIVVSARTEAEIEGVVQSLSLPDAPSQSAWAVSCDVAEPDQVENLYDLSTAKLGHVDILINNAGIARSAPLKSTTLEAWNRTFSVNSTSAFLTTKAFLPGMIEQNWGRIVNVASIAGKVGAPYISAYAASKHALLGLTRAVAAEVATTGVTVNAVCPGYVDTPMTVSSIENIVAKTGASEERIVRNLRQTSPQNRMMEATEVAYLALTLCDPRAKGINGQAIVLDGGAIQS
jgi:NAD(P)-dependent dehydrogenase (short-subunit alcohol dehydrogenase family)